MRQSFRRSSRTPNLEWSNTSFIDTAVSGSSTKVLIGGLTPGAALDFTILRIRGVFGIKSDQSAADEDQLGALGFIIVNADAFTVGITAIPGPITDASADWFLWMPFAHSFEFSTGVGSMADFRHEHVIDNKAQRVFQGTEKRVAIVVESTSASFGFDINIIARILSRVRGTR